MQIAKHTVATFEYTLTDDAGKVIDSSKGREPLSYLHGAGNLVPGLEEELEGKTGGDSFEVRVPPEMGYGERSEQMVQAVPRDRFDDSLEIQVGMQFQAQSEDGHGHVLTVVGVQEDSVVLDGNHPLAGVPLNFAIDVVSVRAATNEEIEHGHVHGPEGHEH